jgi:hypothetical protein
MSAEPSPRPRPAVAGELALVAFLLFGYDRAAAVANVDWPDGVSNARVLLALERSLHLAVESSLNRAVAAHHRLGQVLSVYYDFAHGTVTFGVLLVLYVNHASGYRPARRALVAVNGIGLIVFVVLPMAPPRLLPGAGFVDVVAGSGTWGAWEAATSTVGQHANQYAAMPSLHVAWATWVLQVAWTARASGPVRTLAATHLLVTIGIVLATGNHYVLDVVAGATVATVSWTVASMSWWDLVPPEGRRPADPVPPDVVPPDVVSAVRSPSPG